MNGASPSLKDVFSQLRAEGLIEAGDGAVEHAIQHMADVQPWYVRTMVGFGAWLASLLLVGFVASIGTILDWGYVLFGLGFMVGAVFLRNASANDFTIQCALAGSLAGQALFVFGVIEVANWDEPEAVSGMVIVLNAILFVVFADRIHRVLSVLLVVGSVTVLFYAWEWNAAVPVLGPMLAAALVILDRNRSKLVTAGKGAYLRGLQSGVMLSAFGCLLMSTVYILPELGVSFEFYPRPWVSTVLLGALLVFVARQAWAALLGDAPQSTLYVVYGMLTVVVFGAWNAPGLLLALIVTLLGASSGHRTMVGAGIGFFVLFLAAYFYGIQTTMLQKSATLVASGVAILSARWLILRLLSEERSHV